jgi:hypothetical protein
VKAATIARGSVLETIMKHVLVGMIVDHYDLELLLDLSFSTSLERLQKTFGILIAAFLTIRLIGSLIAMDPADP